MVHECSLRETIHNYELSLNLYSINLALLSDLILSDTPHCHEGSIVFLVDHVTSPQSWMCLLPLEPRVCPHGENSQDENTIPQPFQYPPVRNGHSVINNI